MAKKPKIFLFNPAEAEVLNYLEAVDKRGLTTHMRDALIFYAQNHPRFDIDDFEKHLKKHVVSRLSEKDQREADWTVERLRTKGGQPTRERSFNFTGSLDSQKHLGRKE